MTPGIDVSHFQGVIDWARVKAAGIQFAFIKATDGTSWVDPQLGNNALGCVDVGIPFGLYHFFRPKMDGKDQADHFRMTTGRFVANLPPALDLEIGPVTPLDASIWLDEVNETLGGEPLVYVSPAFALENFGAKNGMGVYPLWIAEYTTKSEPLVPAGWPGWEFWQHSPGGQVAGVPGLVDLDWFNGSAEDLNALIASVAQITA